MDIVSNTRYTLGTRSPNYVWEQKLKATKTALKDWIKNPIDSPNSHRKQTTNQLLDMEMEMVYKEITSSEIQKEQVAQLISFCSFRQEEEHWRLKSRSL